MPLIPTPVLLMRLELTGALCVMDVDTNGGHCVCIVIRQVTALVQFDWRAVRCLEMYKDKQKSSVIILPLPSFVSLRFAVSWSKWQLIIEWIVSLTTAYIITSHTRVIFSDQFWNEYGQKTNDRCAIILYKQLCPEPCCIIPCWIIEFFHPREHHENCSVCSKLYTEHYIDNWITIVTLQWVVTYFLHIWRSQIHSRQHGVELGLSRIRYSEQSVAWDCK